MTGNSGWTLRGKDGTSYALLLKVVQRGNTWFAALEPQPAYATVKPFFDGMAEYLESHGTPPGGELLSSVTALGLHVVDADGAPRAIQDLQILDTLVSFSFTP